jgi:hypothetical protein
MVTKNERNELIIKMHNNGNTERQISDATGLSKSGVHKIIGMYIESIDVETTVDDVKPNVEAGKIFSSFVGWVRLSANKYSNKDTGEVVNVKYIPGNDVAKYGHFVTT